MICKDSGNRRLDFGSGYKYSGTMITRNEAGIKPGSQVI
jgi:hypothetical protein